MEAKRAMIGQSQRTKATDKIFPMVPAKAAAQIVKSQTVYPSGMANLCSTSGRQAIPAVYR